MLSLLDAAPGIVLAALQEQVAALKNPPATISGQLEKLQNAGLIQSTARLRELLSI